MIMEWDLGYKILRIFGDYYSRGENLYIHNGLLIVKKSGSAVLPQLGGQQTHATIGVEITGTSSGGTRWTCGIVRYCFPML